MSPQPPEGLSQGNGGKGLPTLKAVTLFEIRKQIEQIQFHHKQSVDWL